MIHTTLGSWIGKLISLMSCNWSRFIGGVARRLTTLG